MTYPAIIFLALLLWSFSWPKENLVYLMLGTTAFGMLAVFPPAWVGGISLLPNSLSALVLIGRYSLDRRFQATLLRNAFAPDRMGLFTAFMIVATVSVMFFPRLFAGQVEIIPMHLTGRSPSELLRPTPANFTQLAYIGITYGASLCLYSNLSDRKFAEKLLKAFVLGGAILIATGLVDLAFGRGNAGAFAAFKTANYGDMAGAEIMGVRRVIGFMAEASSYGVVTAVFSALALFTFPAIEDVRLRWATVAVGLGCLVMAALSTSSTAIVGLGILAIAYAANSARRIFVALLKKQSHLYRSVVATELLAICILIALLAVGIALVPAIVEVPWQFVDKLVFQKGTTSSYYERMSWSRISLQALYDTHGIGVGIGATRASNWIVSVFSNSGVLGGACLFGFIGWNMVRPIRSSLMFDREAIIGARLTVLVGMGMAALSGTSPDPGLTVGALLALVCALVVPEDMSVAEARQQPLSRYRSGSRLPALASQDAGGGARVTPSQAGSSHLRRWKAMQALQSRHEASTTDG